MYCPKCGSQLISNALFCGDCGAQISEKIPLQTENINTKKNKNKNKNTIKKILLTCLYIYIGFCVIGIITAVTFAIIDKKSNSSEISTTHVNDQINFDLNQFDAHGNLSCGLIWVERTTSSYDQSAKTEFAYFDVNGIQKSEWFESSKWEKSDFSNDLLILRSDYVVRYVNKAVSVNVKVYDTDFNLISVITCDADDNYVNGEKIVELAITDVDENGNIFAIGKIDEQYGLYLINKNGIIKFEIEENNIIYTATTNLKGIRTENEYFVVNLRDGFGFSSYMGVFNKNGIAIFEPSEVISYEVYDLEIISENEFNVKFKGKDDKYYWVKTDSQGNFLNEPTQS